MGLGTGAGRPRLAIFTGEPFPSPCSSDPISEKRRQANVTPTVLFNAEQQHWSDDEGESIDCIHGMANKRLGHWFDRNAERQLIRSYTRFLP